MKALGRFFRALLIERPPARWFGAPTGDPDVDAFIEWWKENAPVWNRDNEHDFRLSLTVWLDAGFYWRNISFTQEQS